MLTSYILLTYKSDNLALNKIPLGESNASATVSFYWLLKHPLFNSPPSPNTVSEVTITTLPVIVQQVCNPWAAT